jgi:ABC-2 type transport system ATP-binding protein
MSASTAIQVSGLEKSFGNTRALDGLDLEVRTGEVHGFVGPNGAGKITTIRRDVADRRRADGGRAGGLPAPRRRQRLSGVQRV